MRSGALYTHRKIQEYEQENVGIKSAHKTEETIEGGSRLLHRQKNRRQLKRQRKVSRLEKKSFQAHTRYQYQKTIHENPQLQQSNPLNKLYQKQRIKHQYRKAARDAKRQAAKQSGTLVARTGRAVSEYIRKNPKLIGGVIACLFVFMLFSSLFASCTTIFAQGSTAVLSSSYLSEPDEIDAAELHYTRLEAELLKSIQEIESENPGFDEYRYNIGAVEHDPFVLIGYLSATRIEFTYEEVQAELDELFTLQYNLVLEEEIEIRTETRTIDVGESIGSVVTSAYCPCAICCGPWANGITATGTTAKANHTVAVDAYNPIVPLGTEIVIGDVVYIAEDTGNLNANGVDFDIYFDTHAEALAWGHKTKDAYLGEGNENQVEVTITEEVTILSVTLEATPLPTLITDRMDEEAAELYALYAESKGNLQIFANPLGEINWYYLIGSYYGYRLSDSGATQLHQGIDIAVPERTDVLATHDGIITTGYDSHYGNYIVITDDDGYTTKLAHLGTVSVTDGQSILAGDVIGKTGSTGSITGSHLHLEVFHDSVSYNPIFYVSSGSTSIYGNAGSAFDDETIARLLAEAQKYIGYPYVWGGSSPSTSFDCSGYISWIYTQSGAYNLGRSTAQGIYNQCTPITASEAKVGDLIFFTGTYSTSEAVTHVGMYMGDGVMLHCGNPIGYASINSAYWSSHFYAFGRLAQ